ncbi:DUF5682 family protein [Cellulomonas sp. S1-8]|uniref:DUF5682 family protein n=1 Tax=Cellulomonas sp. S1-8 TaxID=2904790 RepID=UPI0022431173|nr:DUF5682 family protein [Cellulomonas sp. S1-8]UZN04249.1 DUF5682 family protein [Cellulomonas sp. S1-8]
MTSRPTDALPTGADVRALAARLVTDDVVVVPVRHHSPACARAVAAAFARFAPSHVLIEGPRSLTSLVDLLCHPEARYPLAVYAWSRPAGRATAPGEGHGGYYPFCDYSPELVAARLGHAAGVPVTFCDLEVGEQAAAAAGAVLPGAGSLQREEYAHSRSLTALAERLGCRDHEDLWELLFESGPEDGPEDGLDAHLAAMTAYCLLARHDSTEAELDREGTRQREAEMVWHVQQAVAGRAPGAGPVMVVVGGFHAVALPDLLASPPARPVVDVGDVEEGHALVRYGFDRLDRLAGYASGMTSPGWHQRIWDEHLRGSLPDAARSSATLTTLLDLADELRTRHRTPVATPTLVAAHRQTLLLADLRGRPAPLRSDLVDAVTSCLVQGDADVEGVVVASATRRVLTGDRVGRVPPGTGTPPLVRDTLARLRDLHLDTDATEPRTLALDLYRNAGHRRTSRVLHGLVMLGVPFAQRVAGPDFVRGTGLTRLQERWTYLWSPSTEGVLAEVSMLGSTLDEAVEARFAALVAEVTRDGATPPSGRAVSLLAQGAVVGLHERTAPVVRLVREAVGAETSFVDAVHAAGALALLADGREAVESARLVGLAGLVTHAYARCLYLGGQLQGDEEPPDGVASALSRLRELLASPGGQDLDAQPFWELVDRLRHTHDRAMVRGAAAGLASTAGRLDAEGLARDVAGHLAGSIDAHEAVGFVRGLFATARETVWQESGVVTALDSRLVDWDQPTFLSTLPDLRLAFAGLTPRESDRVAERVAALHGGERPDAAVRRDVDAGTVQALAELSHQLLDVLERDGLGAWAGRAQP